MMGVPKNDAANGVAGMAKPEPLPPLMVRKCVGGVGGSGGAPGTEIVGVPLADDDVAGESVAAVVTGVRCLRISAVSSDGETTDGDDVADVVAAVGDSNEIEPRGFTGV